VFSPRNKRLLPFPLFPFRSLYILIPSVVGFFIPFSGSSVRSKESDAAAGSPPFNRRTFSLFGTLTP